MCTYTYIYMYIYIYIYIYLSIYLSYYPSIYLSCEATENKHATFVSQSSKRHNEQTLPAYRQAT